MITIPIINNVEVGSLPHQLTTGFSNIPGYLGFLSEPSTLMMASKWCESISAGRKLFGCPKNLVKLARDRKHDPPNGGGEL